MDPATIALILAGIQAIPSLITAAQALQSAGKAIAADPNTLATPDQIAALGAADAAATAALASLQTIAAS